MTDIFAARTTSYDGSPSGANEIQSAVGSTKITFASRGPRATLRLFSRTGTADYVETHASVGSVRYIADLGASDDFYFTAEIPSGGSCDLSWV